MRWANGGHRKKVFYKRYLMSWKSFAGIGNFPQWCERVINAKDDINKLYASIHALDNTFLIVGVMDHFGYEYEDDAYFIYYDVPAAGLQAI